MPRVTNIAACQFAPLSDLKPLREQLLTLCKAWNLRGTILLSTEGINLFVAGERPQIDRRGGDPDRDSLQVGGDHRAAPASRAATSSENRAAQIVSGNRSSRPPASSIVIATPLDSRLLTITGRKEGGG